MSKVVIHIGTHKTATTTIQDTFWKNSRFLAKHGLVYPRISRKVTGHHGLVLNWPHMPKPYQLKNGARAALTAISNKYAKTDATVFLSSEEFSRRPAESANELAEMRELLGAFDEIEVICVLRTQWQFLQSVYMEMSKRGVPPRPPKLVDPVIEQGLFHGLWVDYNLLLNLLETTFAPEEITLLDYKACCQSEGGILGHFLRHLGVNLTSEELELTNHGASNVSPLSLAGWAANILSEPRVASPKLVHRIETIMRHDFGEDVQPCIFTREEFNRLSTHFDAKNKTLQDRRAAVQPSFAITQISADELTLFRGDINYTIWVKLCRSLIADPL